MKPAKTVILCEIGHRTVLTHAAVVKAAVELTRCLPYLRDAEISICISGYDADPRSIWDIPEAAAHIRHFAKLTGIDNWKSSPLFACLSEDAIALMKMCDCFPPDFPLAVHIKKNQDV